MYLRPSPATIYRIIDAGHPTFILDEAHFLDDFKNERAQEIRDLFDGGYKKGAKVPRCEKDADGNQTVREYDAYGPKIAGKIGVFTGTMLSRGIDIHLTKKDGLPQSYARLIEQQAVPLRLLLRAYATQYRSALAGIYEKEWDGSSWPFLTGREYELWVPLLIHARLIANTCRDKGKGFEDEAVAVVERFMRRKADLVIADDRHSGLALELLEALESNRWRRWKTSQRSIQNGAMVTAVGCFLVGC